MNFITESVREAFYHASVPLQIAVATFEHAANELAYEVELLAFTNRSIVTLELKDVSFEHANHICANVNTEVPRADGIATCIHLVDAPGIFEIDVGKPAQILAIH